MNLLKWIVKMCLCVVLGLAVGSFISWENLFTMPVYEWSSAGRFFLGFYLCLCQLGLLCFEDLQP